MLFVFILLHITIDQPLKMVDIQMALSGHFTQQARLDSFIAALTQSCFDI